MLFTHCW